MQLTTEDVKKWIERFVEKIETNRAYLSDLDQAIGDGDHGSNMWRGVVAVKEKLDGQTFSSHQELFKLTGMALLSKVGGASGPLYGSAFIEMAKLDETAELAEWIEAGLSGIKKRGKAEVGEKTMVDVWEPVANALKSDTFTKATIDEAIEKTKPLQAKKGRASYLQERSIGHLDPGAVSSGYLFYSLLEGEGFDD